MPPTSRYLARILSAAEHSVTAAQIARVLDVPLSRAANVLRYWERAGFLLSNKERSLVQHRRVKSRYSLTPKGQAALYEQRNAQDEAPQPQQTGD